MFLTPQYDTKGYLTVNIHGKTTPVHRMVADRFCPKIDIPKLEVDHINRCCTDNRASNLRWVDKSTNNRNRGFSNICKDRAGYKVQFINKGNHIYQKWFKTMEEAVAARDAFKLSDAYRNL
jgi:hypothetical protein